MSKRELSNRKVLVFEDEKMIMPVVLLRAWIGVTPVLAMLHALAAEASTREIWWLYGTCNGREHPFAKETHGLLEALTHRHSNTCYSSPDPEDRPNVDFDAPGRLNMKVLQQLDLPRSLVSFARTGLNVRWGPTFHSLLELAEACVPVRRSCRAGVCHTCETGCGGQDRLSPGPDRRPGGRQCADLLLATPGRTS